MAEPLSEYEANVRIARWVSVAGTVALLGFFAAAGFGCKISNDAWQATVHECVSAGGSYIPSARDGGFVCLRGTR